jgi:hypothetical protein
MLRGTALFSVAAPFAGFADALNGQGSTVGPVPYRSVAAEDSARRAVAHWYAPSRVAEKVGLPALGAVVLPRAPSRANGSSARRASATNCRRWSIGVVSLQGMGTSRRCPNTGCECYRCP